MRILMILMMGLLMNGAALSECSVTLALSLSIDAQTLKTYLREGRRRDARLVVRGCDMGSEPFEKNYFELPRSAQRAQKDKVAQCLRRLGRLTQETGGKIEIDPKVFRRYAIEAVPVFIFHDVNQKGEEAIVRGLVSFQWAEEFVSGQLKERKKP